MDRSITPDHFAVGQTWSATGDERHIEVITHNAAGDTLVGYQGDTGTRLATEAEFAGWVQDEVAELT